MGQGRPTLLGRAITLALFLGLVAFSAAPRAANGMGCHVAERPAIGLSESGVARPERSLAGEQAPRRSAQIRPRPCSAETPGSTARSVIVAVGFLSGQVVRSFGAPSSRLIPENASTISRFFWMDRDRPPRRLKVAR